jgi:hypothetical protein
MGTVKVFGPNGEFQEVEVEDVPGGSTVGEDGTIVPPPETVEAEEASLTGPLVAVEAARDGGGMHASGDRHVTDRHGPPSAMSRGPVCWHLGFPLFVCLWSSAGTGGRYPSCFQSSGKSPASRWARRAPCPRR